MYDLASGKANCATDVHQPAQRHQRCVLLCSLMLLLLTLAPTSIKPSTLTATAYVRPGQRASTAALALRSLRTDADLQKDSKHDEVMK